jgi:hypothetical protein
MSEVVARAALPHDLPPNAEAGAGLGTWGHLVLAMFQILPLGFKLSLTIPVTAGAMGQYPMGDAERWRKIVENLGALVAELDPTLVPEFEALVGETPEWYQPES